MNVFNFNKKENTDMDIKYIESELLKLSPHERAAIALKIMESLDGGKDEGTEDIWTEDAQKRYDDIVKKGSKLRKSDKVLREAKSKYNE